MAYNYLDANSLSHYWSSRNEIKFRLKIKFNLKLDLIREYDLIMFFNGLTTTIRQPLDKDDLNEFSLVEKCWLDNVLVDGLSFSYGLEQTSGILYFFERRPIEESMIRLEMREFFQITCQILDSTTGRLIWIKINVKNENGELLKFKKKLLRI